MAKRLLEATKCRCLEELKEYLRKAKQKVVQMMAEDVDVVIDNFVENRKNNADVGSKKYRLFMDCPRR
jgi:hypothetical protein